MGGNRNPALLNGLTPKMERYAQLLSQGLPQRQAYVQAGYSDKSSPDVLDIAACQLAGDSRIVLRVTELMEARRLGGEGIVAERKARLMDIVRTRPQTPVSAGHVVAASAELSKLGGDYAPSKSQVATHVVFEVRYRELPPLPGPATKQLQEVQDDTNEQGTNEGVSAGETR